MQLMTCQTAGLYLPCTQKFRHSPEPANKSDLLFSDADDAGKDDADAAHYRHYFCSATVIHDEHTLDLQGQRVATA
jgi:hypothetical protein